MSRVLSSQRANSFFGSLESVASTSVRLLQKWMLQTKKARKTRKKMMMTGLQHLFPFFFRFRYCCYLLLRKLIWSEMYSLPCLYMRLLFLFSSIRLLVYFLSGELGFGSLSTALFLLLVVWSAKPSLFSNTYKTAQFFVISIR